jgi:hypothetical protein
MAQSFRLKRFTNVAILKRIDFPLLLEFFESDRTFREFLQRRGLTWTRDVDAFDFEELARILMSPSVDTPDELLDALYFVDNLADPDCYDRILEECRTAGIELGNADPSPEDLTLRVWLANRNILERIHAEQYRVRPKKFESYFAAGTLRPVLGNPSATVLAAVEADLNEWYEFKKKGRGRGSSRSCARTPSGSWFVTGSASRARGRSRRTVSPAASSIGPSVLTWRSTTPAPANSRFTRKRRASARPAVGTSESTSSATSSSSASRIRSRSTRCSR